LPDRRESFSTRLRGSVDQRVPIRTICTRSTSNSKRQLGAHTRRSEQDGDAPTSESGSALRWLGSLLRGRQHQAHQTFRPRAPPLHQVQHCCGNTAATQSTWKNTRAPAASNAPDILPTRHYLPQAAKPRVAFNATKPGAQTTLRSTRRAFASPTGSQGGQRGGAPGRLPRRCQRGAVLAPLARSGR
jgi:hypothetical protein